MGILKTIGKFFGIITETPEPIESVSKNKRFRKESTKVTKRKLVRNHLIEKGTITSWQAIDLYGATRLSAIIFSLKDDGMHIESVKQLATDRYGNTSTYVKYHYINGAY